MRCISKIRLKLDPEKYVITEADACRKYVLPRHHSHGAARKCVMNRVPTLGEIKRIYKASTTRFIRSTADENFTWQRNYYEHVIRDEQSFDRIRQYILDNPARWDIDRENPQATTFEPENAWENKPLTKSPAIHATKQQ